MDAESRVRRYYERNTRRFLRFGQGGRLQAIHRAVRHPEAVDPFRFQESHILNLLETHEADSVMDLGCGVGSSLVWLADHRPGRYFGITLSPLQAGLANRIINGRGIIIRAGSYLDSDSYDDLPDQVGRSVFYGIESWLHCPNPGELFLRICERTRDGDIFAICDDFLTGPPGTPKSRRIIDDFREGWHAYNLITPEEADDIAERAGFRLLNDLDLTKWLDIDRPRDRFIAAAVPLLKPFQSASAPWWQNLLGGNALRRSLKSGLIRYRFRTWVRDTM